ncbi:hypothetical protein B566_EDAN018821 [Ephemera danica]|nr:hypothetical protein B566_EDAN018821 [Ephemera danica]
MCKIAPSSGLHQITVADVITTKKDLDVEAFTQYYTLATLASIRYWIQPCPCPSYTGFMQVAMQQAAPIGHIMSGSGLEELWSTVYAPNSVTHMLTGRAIARALRAHFLTLAALMSLILIDADNIEQHQELGKSRQAVDELHTIQFYEWLKKHSPFHIDTSDLISIATRIISSNNVNCDSADVIGDELLLTAIVLCVDNAVELTVLIVNLMIIHMKVEIYMTQVHQQRRQST